MNSTQQLRDLYRQTVLNHSRTPSNFRRLDPADRTVLGHNPLCGDKITLYLRLNDDQINDISFEGTGCAISVTSASIMTETIAGKSVDEAREDISKVMTQLQASSGPDQPISGLGDMEALSGVRAHPSRIKCATLAWKTLEAALQGDTTPVTTEHAR